jgi:hypothetical protein
VPSPADVRCRRRQELERGGLREQGVGLGERRYRPQPVKQRLGLVENRRGFVWLPEADEAAAVALESEGVFGDDAEPSPTLCGVGVAVGGGLVVAACFGEGGVGCNQGVVGVRRVGLVVLGEALGDTALAESERRPYQCREIGREIGVAERLRLGRDPAAQDRAAPVARHHADPRGPARPR